MNMKARYIIFLLGIISLMPSFSFSQILPYDPTIYERWNILDINRVRDQFNNMGELCDGNEQNIPLARPPAFEYPNGSKISYGTCVGVVIGCPFPQDTGAVGGVDTAGLPYLDGTMNEGPAAFWDPEHFAPYPGVISETSTKAPLSTDPTTWPTKGPNHGWPALIPGTNEPLQVGSEGWPGFGKNGERMADQETFSVMYGWRGRKNIVGNPTGGTRWIKTNMEMWGMAWTGQLYQDFIIWVFVIRNVGTAPIKDMRVGIHSDFGYIPAFMSPTGTGYLNRHYYNTKYQFAWGEADPNAYILNPFGAGALSQTAMSGTMALRMPGPQKNVQIYDAFHFWEGATAPGGNGASKELYYKYNLLNEDNPRSSKNNGFCDDFDMDGIPDTLNGGPNYYLADGSDGEQLLGSGALTLQPGESDTLIFATVFGMSQKDLMQNANNAYVLYHSGFKVVKAPPAPHVEIVSGNTKNTIYWSLNSEQAKGFEGYKIYRSEDNGVTWGSSSFTDFDGGVHYIPLEQFDKIDSIKGHYTTLPQYAWYDLGSDNGLPSIKIIDNDSLKYFKIGDTVHVFVDNSVTNGLKYRYYVAAYDTGHGITGPLENTAASTPQIGTNTVEVIPHADASTTNLSQVRVVPNPYVVASGWEQDNNHQVQFTHLPAVATIKIYNISGELIRTLEHNGNGSLASSIETWDLKNENQQLVAPGLYFFYVSSSIGSTQGKFVIIL